VSNGKGDAPRPISNRQKYEDNWDRIFGKKPTTDLTKYNLGEDIMTLVSKGVLVFESADEDIIRFHIPALHHKVPRSGVGDYYLDIWHQAEPRTHSLIMDSTNHPDQEVNAWDDPEDAACHIEELIEEFTED
jgi:hypothetical protein